MLREYMISNLEICLCQSQVCQFICQIVLNIVLLTHIPSNKNVTSSAAKVAVPVVMVLQFVDTRSNIKNITYPSVFALE